MSNDPDSTNQDRDENGSIFSLESDDLEVMATVTGSAAGGAVLVGSVVASGILGITGLVIAGPIVGGILGGIGGYLLSKQRRD